MENEKKAEMSEFAASLKQKWESAVHTLKHDVKVHKLLTDVRMNNVCNAGAQSRN